MRVRISRKALRAEGRLWERVALGSPGIPLHPRTDALSVLEVNFDVGSKQNLFQLTRHLKVFKRGHLVSPVASSDLHIILVRSQLEVKATGFETVVSKWPFEPPGTQFDDGIITSIEQESFFIAKKLLSFSKVILNLKYCPCWSQFINFKKKTLLKLIRGQRVSRCVLVNRQYSSFA